MKYSSDAVEKAIHELSKLPGIGRKTAQRHVFYLLKQTEHEVHQLAEALLELKSKVIHCHTCFNITETDPCRICSSDKRDRSIICVVEEANDVLALEKTGEYRGLYHVLGGALSPLDGIGPDDLRIKELLNRLDGVNEIIVATNPNTEGEATAIYLSKLIKPMGVKMTRIARGIPVGADLEYTDEITLARAIEGRLEY
ncbi:recombination protein RecR [candidate division KSB1 bacterium]|nr:recombination protein RecR [candidate division KSB1 bacterium]RQW05151.1 MAG: recombination protein RecR [candidate division KSB1 bacterium]